MADSRINAEYTFTDVSGKKSTKNLTDLSATATDAQIAALVEGLNSLTTNTLSQINRVETTDITNGGLENAGYALSAGDTDVEVPSIIKMSEWSELTVDAPWSAPLISKYGTGTQSGAQNLTFSGRKPVNSEVKFTNGYVRVVFKGDGHVFAQGTDLFQLQVHIAPTATAQGATLYLYLQGVETDTEVI